VAVSLLGPLQVDGDERLSPRDRVVLSALVIRSGDVLSAEQLADALWGEDPPASWPKVVQGCVARLRRALGRDAVQTTGSGYRLTLTDDEIDVRRFEALVARARALTGAGEHDRAAAVLGQALGLWRGTALPDLDRWPDGRTEAGRLDELRLGAQEALLAERAAAGRDVVADASALVAAQPLRETRWHLLALALYRSGRQSDALAALRQARRTLQEELGLDPGQQLVDLERAILNHDADLVVPTATAGRDLGSARTRVSSSTTAATPTASSAAATRWPPACECFATRRCSWWPGRPGPASPPWCGPGSSPGWSGPGDTSWSSRRAPTRAVR